MRAYPALPEIGAGARGSAVLANEILRTEVGSGVHGMAIEGTDDLDLMAVFIEPRSTIYGLSPEIKHHTWRTQPEGVRSGPRDVDYIAYPLRRFIRMAVNGHPTVLLPLFAPETHVIKLTWAGQELRNMAQLFLSVEAVNRFLGYLHAQHERMMGGGKRGRVPSRPELVEKYGWDVKFGSHALRLAYQGYEIAAHGQLTLPIPPPKVDRLRAIKQGQVPQEQVNAEILSIEHDIIAMVRGGRINLPARPDTDTIGEWMVSVHEAWWPVTESNVTPRLAV